MHKTIIQNFFFGQQVTVYIISQKNIALLYVYMIKSLTAHFYLIRVVQVLIHDGTCNKGKQPPTSFLVILSLLIATPF